MRQLATELFSIDNDADFDKIALELFRIHAENNHVYASYVEALGVGSSSVTTVDHIPFLPIEFFKSGFVGLKGIEAEQVFRSSGTSGMERSEHQIADLELYRRVSVSFFESCYGKLEDLCIMGLLPSYLERNDSSLVFMVDHFVQSSGHSMGGFFLDDLAELEEKLKSLAESDQKTILFGVTFALLDLADKLKLEFPSLTIIETGGMKGRGEEVVREELHARIQRAFPKSRVDSEYGMTELLSQAYKLQGQPFICPSWMKVYSRDVSDPLRRKLEGAGALDIIDLANLYSCPFISTMDLGRVHNQRSFEVLGRIDHSDIRGCSLLVV